MIRLPRGGVLYRRMDESDMIVDGILVSGCVRIQHGAVDLNYFQAQVSRFEGKSPDTGSLQGHGD